MRKNNMELTKILLLLAGVALVAAGVIELYLFFRNRGGKES